jgi:hypothetical protein
MPLAVDMKLVRNGMRERIWGRRLSRKVIDLMAVGKVHLIS